MAVRPLDAEELRVAGGLVSLDALIADPDVGEALDALCVKLPHDPRLRRLVREVVVGVLELDLAVGEELLRLPAPRAGGQRVHRDLLHGVLRSTEADEKLPRLG